jgi:hypothetical protein
MGTTKQESRMTTNRANVCGHSTSQLKRGEAEPGPERPATQWQERETMHHLRREDWSPSVSSPDVRGEAEPGPERPATKWQERGMLHHFVEGTGPLLCRALM